ncbi:DUF397 domain-containing protein [Streptomyces sp. NPDC000594]|uniref:DUF397 domain-containing protein n=1 Tax=Streptomyces sp. NPDC000594 TaxID=3154261 RepID=UPI00331CF00F
MALIEGATESWTKSSYSGGNGACVEVKSPVTRAISVRDSKVPTGPEITFVPGSWNAFVNTVARSAFDLG